MATRSPEFERYVGACTFPGVVDAEAVGAHLVRYLTALGVKREVVQVRAGWRLEDYPSLERYVDRVLEDFAKRIGHKPNDDARAARAALDARAAKKRFAEWCMQRFGWSWSWYRFELSWIATTHIGALERCDSGLQRWTEPLFEAYVAGAWILHWTDDTLFWFEKPTVHVEPFQGQRRLHNENGPALDSAIEPLYFWHGVLVPSFVVIRPDLIQVEHIERAENTEVRRVMLERFGYERYMLESGAELVHSDDFGSLYRKSFQGEREPLLMVHVVNGTVEPDGTRHKFMLGVHPECRPLLKGADEEGGPEYGEPQELTARNAVASTYGMRGEEYAPVIRT